MSNWLGFSLTPHLRNHESFSAREDDEEQNQHGSFPHFSVLPLRSDGTLCVSADPFGRTNGVQDWRYMSAVNGGSNPTEESPKLEDFLGSCYVGPPPAPSPAETKVFCPRTEEEDESRFLSKINTQKEMETRGENMVNPSPCPIQSNHPQPLISIPDSSYKSWLDQTPLFSDQATCSSVGTDSSFQSLSLSMSPSSQNVADNRKRPAVKTLVREPVPRKSIDTFGHRTSQYRGVTRHRWTGRYEAHLWDNSCRKEGQSRKGRQVYLGGYDKEEKAARAYDLAALKYWGSTTHINFPLCSYEKEMEETKNMTRQEFVASLRRRSSGFSRGASMYRGVTRHHQHGRWQARIGRVAGNKDLYLGTFSTQEEAAEAYDIPAIKFRGTSAVTNFDISRYDVKRICSSSSLIGTELAKRSPKECPQATLDDYHSRASSTTSSQHVLAINGGGTTEMPAELAAVMWSGGGEDHCVNNDISMEDSSSRHSSNPQSPKAGYAASNGELDVNGSEHSQAYLFLPALKYDEESNRSGQSRSIYVYASR